MCGDDDYETMDQKSLSNDLAQVIIMCLILEIGIM
jgi:hypothetical protein